MNIKSALEMEELKNASLIAGMKGIYREVKFVEVMEVPDISDWLTEGVLLITTFYSLRDNPEQQIQVFKSLIKVNGAGLVVKFGRYIEDLPEEIYRLANEHHMPIISIPIRTSYLTIQKRFFEEHFKEKSNQLNELDQHLFKNWNNINGILEGISDLLKCTTLLIDQSHMVLAISSNHKDNPRYIFEKKKYPSRIELGLSKRKAVICQNKKSDFHPRIIIPLFYNNIEYGFLHILVKNPLVTINKYRNLLKKTSDYIALELFKYNKKNVLNTKDQIIFFNHLLNPDKGNESIDKSLDKLGFQFNEWNGIACINLRPFYKKRNIERNNNLSQNIMIENMRSIMKKHLNEFLSIERDGFLFLFFSLKDQMKFPSFQLMLKNFNKDINRIFNYRFYIGVSNLYSNMEELPNAINECYSISKFKNLHLLSDSVVIYKNLGVHRYLLQLREDKKVLEFSIDFLHPLLEYDKKNNNGTFLQTLRVFMNYNGNQTKTAEALYIHRRTLKYRMDKIEEILNIDLNDSNDRLMIAIAIKLIE